MKLMIKLKVPNGRKKFSAYPSYIRSLAKFLTENILESEILLSFAEIVNGIETKNDFIIYRNNDLILYPLKENLMDKLQTFYEETEKINDTANKRGDLIEAIIEELIKSGKYKNYNQIKRECCVELINDKTKKILFSTSPKNIDFYVKDKTHNEITIDAKIKIKYPDEQLSCFSSLAILIKSNSISCSVCVVHMLEGRWKLIYENRYPDLELISPSEIYSFFY